MPKGLTLEQLTAMGAKPVPEPTPQPEQKKVGVSLEQLTAMGATPSEEPTPTKELDPSGAVVAKVANQDSGTVKLLKSSKDDGIGTTALKAGINFIPSALSNAWNLTGIIRHPIDTAKGLGSLIAGTAGKGAQYLIENTDTGQKLLEEANASRVARGLPPLERGEDGKLKAPETQDMQTADAVGGYFKGRYGGTQEIKKSVAEDPAGVLLDLSTLFTGGASLAPKVAKVAEVADLAKTASAINKAGELSSKVADVTAKASGVPSIFGSVINKGKATGGTIKDIVTKPADEIKGDALVSGLEGTGDRLKTVKRNIENNTFTVKGEDGVTTTYDPITTFRENNYRPKISMKGDINTDDIRADIAKKRSEIADAIDSNLGADTQGKALDDFKSEIEKQIRNSDDIKAKGQVGENLKKLDAYIEDLRQSYGDNLTLKEINKIRKVQNKDFNPERLDFSRAVGNAGREVVYNSTPDKEVKALLLEERKLGRADDFAEKLNGHKVEGGRLGNMASTFLGSLLGASVDFKPFGFPVGPVVGGGLLRGAQALKQQATFRSIPGEVKGGLEKLFQKSPKINETSINASKTSMPDIIPERQGMVNGGVVDKGMPVVTEDYSPIEKVLKDQGNNIYYHATPNENLGKIFTNGLNDNSFVWPTKQEAIDYAKSQGDNWSVISVASKDKPKFSTQGGEDALNGDNWMIKNGMPLSKYPVQNSKSTVIDTSLSKILSPKKK